jgi:prophage regulatory protein
MHTETQSQFTERLIREAECHAITGLSRTVRWRLSRAGKFPKPLPVTERIKAWRLSEVLAWVEETASAAAAAPQEGPRADTGRFRAGQDAR